MQYSFEGRIRYSEIAPDGRLTLESLIDYFQDCSTFQSEDLGVGLAYLKENHIVWLVNYWQIQISRYPELGEAVRTGTQPYEFRGFMGLRNFIMETKDGERLVTANSVWSLMDCGRMLPAEVPAFMRERYQLCERLEMEYEPRKIALPKENGVPQESIVVAPYHLDTNHHVNNGQYVRLAMGALPEGARVSQLRVEYRRQARLGDVITPVLYGAQEPGVQERRIETPETAGAQERRSEASEPADAQGAAFGAQDAPRLTVALNAEDGKPYAVAQMRL
ncbi:MAG: thioesterase [Eubacteriales bacterium]|nr:thioesterase [Eubacteriales bacterium]